MDQVESPGDPQSHNARSGDLESSVQVLKLPQGVYSFTIKEGGSMRAKDETLALPALQVGVAPVQSPGKVEFLNGAATHERWLAYKNDMIVVRIAGGEASLLLTSVQLKDSASLAVDVSRLNAERSEQPAGPAEPENLPGDAEYSLDVNLTAHIRYVGDLSFDAGRAGWPGQQRWIEGFAVSSAGSLPLDCVEYRGVVSNGFQTPWLKGPVLCGSRGGGLPLLAFAVRLTPDFAERFQCEYSGTFLSGASAGPLHDGVLCTSAVMGDPLEVIELRIIEQKGLDS